MIGQPLTNHVSLGVVLAACSWLLAGTLLGSLYFLSLHWNVRMLARGRTLLPFAIQLFRFVLAAVVLTIVVRSFGAMPLLTATLGLLIARTTIFRWEARL